MNSGLSRATARLKGDRSPFNTSPSDLPEIAGDFRAGGAAPQIFDLSCQRFSARRKTWKPKGFPTLNLPTLNLQGNFFHSGRQAPCREKSPARGVHAAAYDLRSGRSAPDTPGKLAQMPPLKGEVARSAGGVLSARQIRIHKGGQCIEKEGLCQRF